MIYHVSVIDVFVFNKESYHILEDLEKLIQLHYIVVKLNI